MTGSTLFLLLLVGRRSSLSDRFARPGRGRRSAARQGHGPGPARRRVHAHLRGSRGGGPCRGLPPRTAKIPRTAAWWGVFHSISAFNNGGFDLFGEFRSLTGFADAPAILVPIGILVVLGGARFRDRRRRRGRSGAGSASRSRRSSCSLGTVILIAVGALGTAVFEWSNPLTLGRLEPADRVVNAAVPFGEPAQRRVRVRCGRPAHSCDESLFLAIGLMFIGGASGSTAGGIKINTVAVLLVASWSAVRTRPVRDGLRAAASRTSSSYRCVAILLVGIAGAFVLALALQLTGQPAVPRRPVRGRVGARYRRACPTGLTTRFSTRRPAAVDRRDVRRAARAARPRPRARAANATRRPSAGRRAGPYRLTRRHA